MAPSPHLINLQLQGWESHLHQLTPEEQNRKKVLGSFSVSQASDRCPWNSEASQLTHSRPTEITSGELWCGPELRHMSIREFTTPADTWDTGREKLLGSSSVSQPSDRCPWNSQTFQLTHSRPKGKNFWTAVVWARPQTDAHWTNDRPS